MRYFLAPAALAALLAAALLAPAAADGAQPPRVLSVNGTGEVKAVPDQAHLSTGVVTQAPQAAAALAANSRAMNAVFDALKRAGLADKDIRTSNFSVSPQYRNAPNGPQRISGYEVSNTVNVTVTGLDRLGATIDALVSSGSNQIDGPSFTIADTAPLLAKAREAAVKDAIDKAQAYARAAGVTLGPILSINEGGSYAPEPMASVMSFKAAAAPTPIAAGEASVSANVSVSWEIR